MLLVVAPAVVVEFVEFALVAAVALDEVEDFIRELVTAELLGAVPNVVVVVDDGKDDDDDELLTLNERDCAFARRF